MSKKIFLVGLNMKTVASPMDNIIYYKMSNCHFVCIQYNMIDLLRLLCQIY